MNQALENNGPALAHPDSLAALNRLLGQRRAFATVSGRCSAAHAELLRRIRTEKLYLPITRSWREFCRAHLAISRRHADRLIALLERFGSSYFELAACAGVTAEQYALLEPFVREGRLHADGEAISLIPENSALIGDAVYTILERANPAPAASIPFYKRVIRLDFRTDRILAQYRALYRDASTDRDLQLIVQLAENLRDELLRLQPPSTPLTQGGLTRG